MMTPFWRAGAMVSRMLVRVVGLAALVMAVTVWPSTEAHAESSAVCGKVLTTDTVLPHATYDCGGSGVGLIIGRDGITVDLNFSTIRRSSIGIRNSGHADVTIKNGRIHESEIGVQLLHGDDNRLLNVSMEDMTGPRSLVVGHSSHVLIDTVHGSITGQFLFAHDRHLTVRDSGVAQFSLADAGFLVRDTTRSSFVRSKMGNEGGGGIQLVRSDHNLVLGSVISGSELFGPGIELIDSHHNRIANNSVTYLRVRGGGIALDRRSTRNAV